MLQQHAPHSNDLHDSLPLLRGLNVVYDEICRAIPGVGPHNMMIAGGAIRDLLTGNSPSDIDVFIHLGGYRSRFGLLMGRQSQTSRMFEIQKNFREYFKKTHEVYKMLNKRAVRTAANQKAVVVLGNLADIMPSKLYSLDDTIEPMSNRQGTLERGAFR